MKWLKICLLIIKKNNSYKILILFFFISFHYPSIFVKEIKEAYRGNVWIIRDGWRKRNSLYILTLYSNSILRDSRRTVRRRVSA